MTEAHIHIYAPQPDHKSLTRAPCFDCKQESLFVGFNTPWLGWDETCIRCGRRWQDGEWMALDFYRHARRDSIRSARKRWRRSTAKVIKRAIVEPSL